MEQFNVDDNMKVNIDYEKSDVPPSVRIFHPLLWKDGNAYCCVLGPDPQAGIFGCGETPDLALTDWADHFEQWKNSPDKDKDLEAYINDTLQASVTKIN